jgi:hypothetical protein
MDRPPWFATHTWLPIRRDGVGFAEPLVRAADHLHQRAGRLGLIRFDGQVSSVDYAA